MAKITNYFVSICKRFSDDNMSTSKKKTVKYEKIIFISFIF